MNDAERVESDVRYALELGTRLLNRREHLGSDPYEERKIVKRMLWALEGARDVLVQYENGQASVASYRR